MVSLSKWETLSATSTANAVFSSLTPSSTIISIRSVKNQSCSPDQPGGHAHPRRDTEAADRMLADAASSPSQVKRLAAFKPVPKPLRRPSHGQRKPRRPHLHPATLTGSHTPH